MIRGNDRVFRVHGVNEHLGEIEAYLRNKVDTWCENHVIGNGFAARDLIGGKYKDWNGTPLQVLYNHYLQRRHGDVLYAYREAAKAAGRILKGVLKRDAAHTFLITRDYKTIRYELV